MKFELSNLLACEKLEVHKSFDSRCWDVIIIFKMWRETVSNSCEPLRIAFIISSIKHTEHKEPMYNVHLGQNHLFWNRIFLPVHVRFVINLFLFPNSLTLKERQWSTWKLLPYRQFLLGGLVSFYGKDLPLLSCALFLWNLLL